MKKTINPANIKLSLFLKIYTQQFTGDPQLDRKMALLKEGFLYAQKEAKSGRSVNTHQFVSNLLTYIGDSWYQPLKNRDGFLKVVNNLFASVIETATSQNMKTVTNRPNPNEAFQQIMVDFNGSQQRGLLIPLTTITDQPTPERAYREVESQLADVGLKMATNLGSYGIVTTGNNGKNENYVGIAGRTEPIRIPKISEKEEARLKAEAEKNGQIYIRDMLHEDIDRKGYTLEKRGISARNIYELWSMRPGNTTQYAFQRDSQYGRVSIIHVAPIAEISDDHVKKMLEPNKTHEYQGENYLEDYLAFLESYSMGLFGAFGILDDETGLNILEAESKKAFLAGFSVRNPRVYKDLIVFSEKHMLVRTWSKEYERDLMAIQLLAETSSKGLKHASHQDTNKRDGMADSNVIDSVLSQRKFTQISSTGKLYFHYWQDFYKTLLSFNEFQRDKGPIRQRLDDHPEVEFPSDLSHENELRAQKVYTDLKKITDQTQRLLEATSLVYDKEDQSRHKDYIASLCDHRVRYYVRPQAYVDLPKKVQRPSTKEIDHLADNDFFKDSAWEPDLDR